MKKWWLKSKPILKGIGLYTLITLKWLVITGIIAGFLVGGAAFGYVSAVVKDEPVRTKEFITEQISDNAVTGFVFFNDDTPIGQLRTDEDRRLVGLNDIPKMLLDAVIAVEDKDFYTHYGVDVNGLFRAVKQKLLNEPVQTGGSTITQQLARRVFLSLDRDITRKFKEIFLSLRLERMMSKDEILLAYLNKIPYGNGSNGYNLYGIKAAAKGIFDINDLNELNIAQTAYLAGLPQLPSEYSAFTSKGDLDKKKFDNAIKRQQLVLKRMTEENVITSQQYEEALAFDLKGSLAAKKDKEYSTYPYLMLEAEKQAAEILLKLQYPNLVIDSDQKKEAYNEAIKDVNANLQRGGYQVYTTIDKTIYDAMQEIAKNDKNFSPFDEKKGLEQIGAVLMDSKTSAILGMIEGRDFFAEQLNHANQAYRQPGSAMKPIAAFVPALEMGAVQPASVIDDSPIILPDGQKGVHLPNNWDNKYHGLITARKALNSSYNIPAIKLFLNVVGINKAWDYAMKMGISSITKQDYAAQTGVIGGLYKGVNVEEMTNAYATIANKGLFNEAYLIRKIVDAKGKTIYEHELKPSFVFSEQTAYLMTDMMRTVVTSGTANDLPGKFKHYKQMPIVGKTGSTQDDGDAWFIGYTPDMTLGVWAGYDQPVHKLSKATGGTNRAKNIWALVMDAAMDKRPDLFPTKKFDRPANIVEMTVSDLSGKLPTELTTSSGHLVKDIFNKRDVPNSEDDVMVKMKVISYNGVNYIALPSTPDDFVQEKIVIRREESISAMLKKIEAAQQKLPASKRKSLKYYIPLDADTDAPSENDPRGDDGKSPEQPSQLLLTRSGDSYKLSFAPSSSGDVVGYRLYRSAAHGQLQAVGGKVVMAGAEPIFSDSPGGGIFGYTVVAVDVAGHESAVGKVLYTDGTEGSGASQTNQSGALQEPEPNDNGAASPSPTPGQNGGTAPDKGGDKPKATAVPSAPAGLTVKLKGMSLQLNWKANADKDAVKQYNVYYAEKENGKYRKLGSVNNAVEFSYYAVVYDGSYRVTAVNDIGESSPSAAVNYKKPSE